MLHCMYHVTLLITITICHTGENGQNIIIVKITMTSMFADASA